MNKSVDTAILEEIVENFKGGPGTHPWNCIEFYTENRLHTYILFCKKNTASNVVFWSLSGMSTQRPIGDSTGSHRNPCTRTDPFN